MGLGDMENDVKDILAAMKAELEDGAEGQEKKSTQRKEKELDIDLDEMLNSLPDIMIKEKKRAQEMGSGWKKPENAWTGAKEQDATKKKQEPVRRTSGIAGNAMERMAQMEQPERTNHGWTVRKKGKRLHILIVDDDIRILRMMKEILKEDYDTAVAPNGEAALKFLESHSTDLILLDYMMPNQNGKEVLEKIRSNPALAELPVVFLTGMSDSRKVKECLALHPQGYILKPVKQEKLLKRVREILHG